MTETNVNGAMTTLAAPCGAVDSSITVAAAATVGFPASGTFRITVYDPTSGIQEIMLVASPSGTTFPVTRAYEPTGGYSTAQAFPAGALVRQSPTVGAVEALILALADPLGAAAAAQAASDPFGSAASAVVAAQAYVNATPNIGTPSAGNLVNCTGFPAAPVSSVFGRAGAVTALVGDYSSYFDLAGAAATAQAAAEAASDPAGSATTALAAAVSYVNGTPALGTPSAGILSSCSGYPYGSLTGAPSIPAGANPSASVGLAAVNGSAGTFMTSDSAPALNQAIVPTWTGLHTFNVSPSSPFSSTSERFGYGAGISSGDRNCLFGNAAGASLTTGDGNTIFGYQAPGSNFTTQRFSTIIGTQISYGTAGGGGFDVIIGANSQRNGSGVNYATSVGYGNTVSGNNAIAIGASLICGDKAISIGSSLTNTGTQGIAIGYAHTITNQECVFLGSFGTSNKDHDLHFGTGDNATTYFTMNASSSAAFDRCQMQLTNSWIDATDASRTSRVTLSAVDYNGLREGIRIEANGTVALVGLYGDNAVAQPAAITAPSGGATVDSEARTAISAILAAIGAAAGGIGITA